MLYKPILLCVSSNVTSHCHIEHGSFRITALLKMASASHILYFSFSLIHEVSGYLTMVSLPNKQNKNTEYQNNEKKNVIC